MQQMEWREAIEDAADNLDALDELAGQLRQASRTLESQFARYGVEDYALAKTIMLKNALLRAFNRRCSTTPSAFRR